MGPVFWFYIYELFGIFGLKLCNLIIFVLLFFTHYALGKGRYSRATIICALFLVAFYVGTNRNIVAGEPDDNMATLLFSLGVLVYLNTGRTFSSSVLMGAAFLFKFWIAIFCLGFGLYLLSKRRWRELWPVAIGMLLPFLLINFVDGFESTRSLWVSLNVQKGFSRWGDVAIKMLSTGMVFCVLASGWTWLKRRNDSNTLFFLVSSIYFVYVVVNRDAWAASFVMMQCLMFSSFLIAELVLHTHALWNERMRNPAILTLSVAYVMLTSAITYQHLYRDTKPIVLVADPSKATWNFHRNNERTWAAIFRGLPTATPSRISGAAK